MASHVTSILTSVCALALLLQCDVTSGENYGGGDFVTAIATALRVAHDEFGQLRSLDEKLFRSGVDTKMTSGSRHMHGQFRLLEKSSISNTDHALVVTRATQELTKIFGRTVDELKQHPHVLAVWRQLNSPVCAPRLPVCRTSRYRTVDGSCNNLQFTTWGMTGRPQKRYLPSAYHDDVGEPRQLSVTGGHLPSPRLVSNVIHQCATCDVVEPLDSVLVMQWGQLMDHDFLDTPVLKDTLYVNVLRKLPQNEQYFEILLGNFLNTGFKNSDIMCCKKGPKFGSNRPSCFPIEVPSTDKHFSTSCMNFIRSAPATDDNCDLGRRNQMNQLSSYLDASYIYGVDDDDLHKMRQYSGGYLKMMGASVFPPDANQDKCMLQGAGDYCMKSGDRRLHVVPTLAASQILMLREHNRIAHTLANINPHWDDELLFQETRKIVMAINQHITYAEFLPVIVGHAHMSKYGLYSKSRGFNTMYDPLVDATLANSFGAAAYRFGHSQIPGNVDLIYTNNDRLSFKLEETFNKPATLFMDAGKGCDHVNRWMANDRSAKSDRFLEPAVRDNLFLDDKGESFDLAALNIQRGRDHGIPSYNAWRKWCGLAPAFHFGFTAGGLLDMEPDSAHLLSKVYSHPDDIDLFTGGLAERHVLGGAMGPTFACIVARQFKELKLGDRFFYENNFPETGFTKLQISSIKRIRLSKILCNNIETTHTPRDAFKIPSKHNAAVPCHRLPDIDFRLWRDLRG